MEEEKFTLLRRFQYSSEAIIYQGKLESQGIEVFMRDHNTVDSNPLYSNAVGGVKLFVRTEDFNKANEVLSDVSLYSVDDDHQPIKCPECGAEKVDIVTSIKDWKSLLAFVFSWVSGLFPIYAKHKYKCETCKTEFD
jgi:DNA-directed RNA polymerase subunit RPC12/RpoP